MAKKPAKPKKPQKPPPPLCLGLILADSLHRDPGSGKWTILGTFSTLFSQEFPCQHPLMAVFGVLSDGRGTVRLEIRLVDVDEEHGSLASAAGEVQFEDPRAVVEFAIPLPGVMFPEPGEYRVQCLADGELLMERRLMVVRPDMLELGGNADA